jgi:selenide,water dikinase
MAISVLGWPLEKLSSEMAGEVLDGAREICLKAGIPLAGGHSIDISDPVFGLAVTGLCEIPHIKRNSEAVEGCRLYLSKPLGIGIMSTANKKSILSNDDYYKAVSWMTHLNTIGTELGRIQSVRAMTDVTGFGLLGHLLEICEGSGLSAVLEGSKIPLLGNLQYYIDKNCIPGGTWRNWQSYGTKIEGFSEFQKLVFADPQTSGGLLIAVDPDPDKKFLTMIKDNTLVEIGYLKKRTSHESTISVE